jgi:hypothetical protein
MKGSPHRNEKGNMLDEFVIIEVGESSRVARQIDEGLQSVVSSDLQYQMTLNTVIQQPLPHLDIGLCTYGILSAKGLEIGNDRFALAQNERLVF